MEYLGWVWSIQCLSVCNNYTYNNSEVCTKRCQMKYLQVHSYVPFHSVGSGQKINTLRPRQNGRHLPDDIFKWIFLNENVWISTKIPLMFVPKGLINNIPALVQIMAWRRSGDKPLLEPMMVNLLTHICVIRPQWVKDAVWTQISI